MKLESDKRTQKIVDAILIRLTIERERKEPKMTQRDVARKLGIDPASVGRIESGESELTIPRFFILCQILNLNPVEVFTTAVKKVDSTKLSNKSA